MGTFLVLGSKVWFRSYSGCEKCAPPHKRLLDEISSRERGGSPYTEDDTPGGGGITVKASEKERYGGKALVTWETYSRRGRQGFQGEYDLLRDLSLYVRSCKHEAIDDELWRDAG